MKVRLFLLASIAIVAFSCKKSTENAAAATPPPGDNVVEVLLKLTGDITTSESPLGRKVPANANNARTLRDSTIYWVIVRKDNKSIYGGLFNQADSIRLKLPVTGMITVQAAAYKKGSGEGLFYYWQNGQQNYGSFLGNGNAAGQLNSAVLTNKMDTIRYVFGYTIRVDTVRNIRLFKTETDSTWNDVIATLHTEADAYVGETTFAAAATPTVVTLPMKRYAFGVQYSAANFNSGRLIADFSGAMPTRYLTPGDTVNQYLYSAQEFFQRDSLLNDAVTVKMKWEKPDGDVVPLGEKKIFFKRNVLTKISVTIPPPGSAALGPVISEMTWSGSETVNF
ncbi:hypothetical protein [Chitinophaga sp. GbtcB8]|uniref:hypothetical protein n=1 Tax=Chitinophaga sp. GbtcB8 TaxID=2824753 RepID=UPI001C301573|nr:hypothetical protein [Chitinophaga sp. GbtcB8]